MIYTTNTLEGFNRQLRKVTKIRTIFPNDDALRKSIYLATVEIMGYVSNSVYSPKWMQSGIDF